MRKKPGPVVLRPSDIPARERGGGARTIPLVTRHSGSTTFISGMTIFAPGAAIPLHFRNCEESVLLLDGEAVADIDVPRTLVETGEARMIDEEHRAAVAD